MWGETRWVADGNLASLLNALSKRTFALYTCCGSNEIQARVNKFVPEKIFSAPKFMDVEEHNYKDTWPQENIVQRAEDDTQHISMTVYVLTNVSWHKYFKNIHLSNIEKIACHEIFQQGQSVWIRYKNSNERKN